MLNINFSDKFLVSMHNAIGGNISTATTKGLLDKIEKLGNKSGTLSQGIVNALGKKAKSKEGSNLAIRINLALTKNDTSNNKQVAGVLKESTTRVLPNNKVSNANFDHRVFVSANARKNGINLQLPNELKTEIHETKQYINELSRQIDLLTVVKSSFVSRSINHSSTYQSASTEQQKEIVKTIEKSFGNKFGESLVNYLVKTPETQEIIKDKEVKPFTPREVTRLFQNSKATTYEGLMTSVLNKIEKQENKLSKLNNELNKAQNNIDNNEIASAEKFLGLPSDNSLITPQN